MKGKDINIIYDKEKKIANHYYTESGSWLIVWVKDLKNKDIYEKEIRNIVEELNLVVEFKDGR